MGMMSIRELNANVSRALAAAESGEDITLTRNGKAFLRITREGVDQKEQDRQQAVDDLIAMMKRGINLGGPATYDERTGR